MVFGQEPMDRKVRVKADGIILKTAINQFWAQVKLPVAFRQKKKNVTKLWEEGITLLLFIHTHCSRT